MQTLKTASFKYALLTVLITGLSLSVFSQTEEQNDKTLSPYFFVQSQSSETDQLPLKSTSAIVNIAGVIADVRVRQVYKNEGSKALEAIYIFPGSTRAAVYGLQMTIGERTIVAKIEERVKARQDYEEAKQNGQSASLLEQQRPNVFQMNVANIMPGDEIMVELSYTELLIPDEGIYEFVYPTVVGPRYSNTPENLATNNEKWIANPYTNEGQLPLYTFDLAVNLNAGMPVQDVVCNTHETDVQFLNPDEVKIDLKDAEKFGGNRDFILKYRLQGEQIQSGLLLYEGEKENFFLLMVQPPKQIKPENIPPREYVFIVDVSGSMHGFPLEISKSLMKDLIGKLRPEDKFNVLLFAGGSELYSTQSVDATSANIKDAINFIDRQQGGGGTELLPALRKALALRGTEKHSRTFIIATDGYVTVEKEAYDLIRKNLGTANFFTFGIGSSVNRYLLEGMAHVGKGIPFVATTQAEASSLAIKFRKYITNPVLTNIKVAFNEFDVYDLEPMEVPDVFSERPVLVYGKYRGNVIGSIELTGKTGDKDYKWGLEIKKYTRDRSNTALKYLWARERVRILDDYAFVAQNEGQIDEITALGLKYNLLTAYTSFIAIDSDVRNQDGNVTTVKQPLPLPEGVSNYAVGMPATLGLRQGGSGYKKGLGSVRSENMATELSYDREIEYEEELVFTMVGSSPEFKEGNDALLEFIQKHMLYPEDARKKGIEGTVYVEFIVNEDGTLADISIVNSIFQSLDEEAKRVISLTSGKWKAAEQNGQPVKASMIVSVKFKL
ncbi:MAG: TonB family protein [Bacteroidales bacterium]